MPVFLELTPAAIQGEPNESKRMYRLDNIHSFQEALEFGEDWTLIIFNPELDVVPVVVRESYESIWLTLNDLNLVEIIDT